jgi:hypothetical protein
VSWAAREWAKRQTPLPRKAGVLLFHFADEANDQAQCWPDQEKLAERTGWAKGTIKKWTDLLRALSLISTKKRFNKRKGYCDAMIYTVHLDRVVTPREVERQIANLRFASGGGKSQKQGLASGGGKSQPAANSKSQPAANISQDPQGDADAASAPPGARAGRVEAPPDDEDRRPSPAAARARELAGPARPAHDSGREGMRPVGDIIGHPASGRSERPDEHEARHGRAVAPAERSEHGQPVDRDKLIEELTREASPQQRWQAALHAWRQSGGKVWDDAADGPRPGAPGCRVPAELLNGRTMVARKGPATPAPAPVGSTPLDPMSSWGTLAEVRTLRAA